MFMPLINTQQVGEIRAGRERRELDSNVSMFSHRQVQLTC